MRLERVDKWVKVSGGPRNGWVLWTLGRWRNAGWREVNGGPPVHVEVCGGKREYRQVVGGGGDAGGGRPPTSWPGAGVRQMATGRRPALSHTHRRDHSLGYDVH